jgi:hypothetical protein
MNWLEDAFWSARAAQLASSAGAEGRAALVVRRGRLLAQAIEERGAPELAAIAQATPRAHGSTVYLAHPPDALAIELARTARVRRIVLGAGVWLEPRKALDWERSGIRVERIAAAA